MLYLLDDQGNYFEADKNLNGSTELPVQRPTHEYDWDGETWVLNEPRKAQNEQVVFELFRTKKLADVLISYVGACTQDVIYTSVLEFTAIFQANQNSLDSLKAAIDGWRTTEVVPEGYYWVSSDNVRVPFSYEDLYGLFNVIATQRWEAYQRLQAVKIQVRNATTIKQLDEVVW